MFLAIAAEAGVRNPSMTMPTNLVPRLSLSNAIILLVILSATVAAQERGPVHFQPPRWSSRLATEGMELQVVECDADGIQDQSEGDEIPVPTYQFKVTGAAEETRFHLWWRTLNREPIHMRTGADTKPLVVGKDGFLVTRVDGVEQEFSFRPESVLPGQTIEFCLRSEDRTNHVYSSVIPARFVLRKQGHQIEVRMYDIYLFEIAASGFEDIMSVDFKGADGNFSLVNRFLGEAKEGIGFHITDDEDKDPIELNWEPPRLTGTGTSRLSIVFENPLKQIRRQINFDLVWGTGLEPMIWDTSSRDRPKQEAMLISRLARRLDPTLTDQQADAVVKAVRALEQPTVSNMREALAEHVGISTEASRSILAQYHDSDVILQSIAYFATFRQ